MELPVVVAVDYSGLPTLPTQRLMAALINLVSFSRVVALSINAATDLVRSAATASPNWPVIPNVLTASAAQATLTGDASIFDELGPVERRLPVSGLVAGFAVADFWGSEVGLVVRSVVFMVVWLICFQSGENHSRGFPQNRFLAFPA